MSDYGPNAAQVDWVLERLAAMDARDWRRLEAAHQASGTADEVLDAIVEVLDRTALRDGWFALRARVAELATAAASGYAKESGEEARAISVPTTGRTWQGEVDIETVMPLGPEHEMSFRDAAAAAAGLVMIRLDLSVETFQRLWTPYEPVIGLPEVT